jgi:hypothetical protein
MGRRSSPVAQVVISGLRVIHQRSVKCAFKSIRSVILSPIVGDLEQLAKSIRTAFPGEKLVSIRLWGESLGRPGEDGVLLTGCETVNDCLRLKFADGEVLAVWSPLNVEITAKRFMIGSAESMRFTHYYCGRPMLPDNIIYRDYALQGGLVRFRTNLDRVPGSGWMHESTAISFPAVEIIFDPYASFTHF